MNVIQIENLWKEYLLGVIGHGTLTHDLQSWWARIKGQEDPNAKISSMLKGQENQIEGDRFWALRDINLNVKQGEILGVIGKNGAGKSTLLKILSRVTAPTSGTIKVKGRIASLLEVGTGFHQELTGRENVFLNGAILGMSKQEVKKKFDEIVNFSGVDQYLETPVKRYSSGMRVRLAFAVAAHLEPEILVIDEVLAVGDAEFQKKCLGKMSSVVKEGRTILFVSHNMGAVKSLTERCVLLVNGGISISGKTSLVIDEYLKNESESLTTNFEKAIRSNPDYGKIIKICDVIPLPKTNGVLKFGDPIEINIRIVSTINEDHLRYGITLSDLYGNPIIACFTNECVSVNKNSDLTNIIVISDTRIVPGKYRISLSIGKGSVSGKNRNYDAIIDGPIIEIVSISSEGKNIFNWNQSWGYIWHNNIRIE